MSASQAGLALHLRRVLDRRRRESFFQHAVLREHHAAVSAVASGTRLHQRSRGNWIGCASPVSAVVCVSGMGIDLFAHRSVPGKYSHGAPSRIVHLGIVDGPLASSSTSGRADRLGLLVHVDECARLR